MRCAACGGSVDCVPIDPSFDDQRREVIAGTERRHIGAQPYRVIELLRLRPGRRVSKTYLHQKLPGSPNLRTIDAYLCRARAALEGTPWRIETLRGGDVILSRRPMLADVLEPATAEIPVVAGLLSGTAMRRTMPAAATTARLAA